MLKNHKGEFCWINPNLFCQEGYCSNCEIYQRSPESKSITDVEKLKRLAKYRDRKQQELEGALSLTARIRVAQGRAGGLPK